MLSALAKLGSPDMVGQFALGLAVTSPVIVLSNLQLRAVQATDARSEYTFDDYWGLRAITTTAAMLSVCALVFAGSYSAATAWVILLVGLAKAVESMSDVLFGFLQRRELMHYVGISQAIKGCLSFAAFVGTVAVTRSVVWGSAAMLAAWTCVLLLYDLPVAARAAGGWPRVNWRPRTYRQLAWLSLPLGLVMMMISLQANIPRYFVEHDLGTAKLGIFAALAYVPVGGQALVNALGTTISPRLSVYYANRKIRDFVLLTAKALAFGALLGVAATGAAAIAGERILSILYRAQYASENHAFVLLMAAGGVGYIGSFLGCGVTAARRFNVQLPIYCLIVTATLAGSWWLVPRFGISGAAWALLAASIIGSVLLAGAVWRALSQAGRVSFPPK